MATDISDWLAAAGLARYAGLLEFHGVDMGVLGELGKDDLAAIGVPLGDRLRILRAIRAEFGAPPPQAAHQAVAPIEPAVDEAERRPLTVMFCDLADSTALSTRLDPEDLQDVIRAYQEVCAKAVQSFGGFVAKYMGDGILVYFGYPKSLERNAERAVRSALDILGAISVLNGTLGREMGVELAVRIGIATGTVMVGGLVGEGTAQERTVIGEAPNMAARLQGLAGRGGIVIGALTRDLAGDAFAYHDLGVHKLKGIEGAVPAWGVIGLCTEDGRDAETVGDAAASPVLTLVGRDEEIGLLRRAWQSTLTEGRGQVVSISGEAGIGKSALIDGLRADVRASAHPQITLRCSPYHGASTLHPIIEHYKRLAGWRPEDDADIRLAKLEAALEPYDAPSAETVPLLASLLSLPLPAGRYPPLTATPQAQRGQTQDIIIAMVLEQAERRPLLALWEDLHWADPSTLEVLAMLIEQAPTASLLIATTARPEFAPPWAARSHLTPITLNRLERPHAEALINRLAGAKPLPPEVVEHIVVKTDGVPLYVEELTKTILASDILRDTGGRFELTGPLSSLSIPDTLQESLMARLDRLPQVRELAQIGSVLGREFAYEMISGLSNLSEEVLRAGLGQLVDAELLYQRGRPPRARYIFKHALIQDAAYQSLLRRARQQVHLQAAELLEVSFPDIVDASPEIVARHYAEAGDLEKAAEYWQRAAQRAVRRFAHHETISHFRNVTDTLAALKPSAERTRQAAGAQIAIAGALSWTAGPGAAEVGEAYAAARSLCEGLEDARLLSRALLGSMGYCKMRGEWSQGEAFARQLLTMAQASGLPPDLLAAHVSLGECFTWQGRLPQAAGQIDEAVALDRMISASAEPIAASPWARVAAHSYLAWIAAMKGRRREAFAANEKAIALAEALSHPFSQVFALHFAAALALNLRRPQEALAWSEAEIALATQHRFSAHVHGGHVYRGVSLEMQGGGADATEEIREGVFGWRDTGGETGLSMYQALHASILAKHGLVDEASTLIQAARDRMEASDERVFEAEVLRIHAEIALARCDDGLKDAALETLTRAIAVARHQGAHLFELRASVTLARVLTAEGRDADAHQLLASALASFKGDFDTVDLIEARSLLSAPA